LPQASYLAGSAAPLSTFRVIVYPETLASNGPNQSMLLYFSFTTLTTTSCGDITAANRAVRTWSIFDAIIATMYSATVIARVMSLDGSHIHARNEQTLVQPDTT
jgi:hypothetical protein